VTVTTILYFAWVRELTGTGDEQVDVPDFVMTVSDLADWLSAHSDGHAAAFADRTRLRVAVDQTMATFDARIAGAREIAFFPPVTGG
jgi:sulfur-carrier protein